MITSETVSKLIMPNPEGVPQQMRERRQWITWRLSQKSSSKDEFTKIPTNPKTGENASSTDPNTWSDFETAVAHWKSGKASGLGFVTSPDDGMVLIDLDNCRDPVTGELTSDARRWIDSLNTYVEVSPSGTGLHAFLFGNKTTSKCKNTAIGVECYDRGRFFCVTGVAPDDSQYPISDNQESLEKFLDECFPEEEETTSPLTACPLPTGVDEQRVLDKLKKARNSASVIALLQGDISAHNNDRSSADQALCNHLAFWCDRDLKLMDSLFRQSGLMREKWDERHSSEGLTYGQMTLQRAIEKCQQTYGWEARDRKRKAKELRKQQQTSPPQILSESLPESTPECALAFADLEPEESFYPDDATDKRNAEILVEIHGFDLLYCPQWKSWLIWDGVRWKRDESNQIILKAHAVSRYWFDKVPLILGEEDQKACLRHAQRAANTKGIENFLKQAQALCSVSVEELNLNPWLLNCPNGTINLKTGELYSHHRADRLTVVCPTRFDPEASSWIWDQFLESTFADHGDVIPFLQRLFGSALSGEILDHILPVLHGSGANGKSTLLNAILLVLGADYSMQANPELLMDTDLERHPTERADLYGKRFVSAVESEANKRLKESFVKALTGGDPIRARFLYKDFFQFNPTHMITLCTNHKPKVVGDDHGIWRRLRLIPFYQQFGGKNADPHLPQKLRAEAEGILAWMVRGCLDWQAQGLNEPETVMAATNEYKSESDVIGQFINSECYQGPQMKQKFCDIFEAMEAWCVENGETPPTKHKFGRVLKERFEQIPEVRGRWYQGIGLKNQEN